jgi:hypothetical protein
MRVALRGNYRVSWQSTLGGVPAEVYEDNDKPWSGDHCTSDPRDVLGILFSNRALSRREVAIVDVGPSVLPVLGVPVPDGLAGRSFLEEGGEAR